MFLFFFVFVFGAWKEVTRQVDNPKPRGRKGVSDPIVAFWSLVTFPLRIPINSF